MQQCLQRTAQIIFIFGVFFSLSLSLFFSVFHPTWIDAENEAMSWMPPAAGAAATAAVVGSTGRTAAAADGMCAVGRSGLLTNPAPGKVGRTTGCRGTGGKPAGGMAARGGTPAAAGGTAPAAGGTAPV